MTKCRKLTLHFGIVIQFTDPGGVDRSAMRSGRWERIAVAGFTPRASGYRHCTFSTLGGVQVPLMIDGLFSFGQYIRSIGMKSPLDAGSQLASLPLPGDACWKLYKS